MVFFLQHLRHCSQGEDFSRVDSMLNFVFCSFLQNEKYANRLGHLVSIINYFIILRLFVLDFKIIIIGRLSLTSSQTPRDVLHSAFGGTSIFSHPENSYASTSAFSGRNFIGSNLFRSELCIFSHLHNNESRPTFLWGTPSTYWALTLVINSELKNSNQLFSLTSADAGAADEKIFWGGSGFVRFS